jgi:hypothetical protein
MSFEIMHHELGSTAICVFQAGQSLYKMLEIRPIAFIYIELVGKFVPFNGKGGPVISVDERNCRAEQPKDYSHREHVNVEQVGDNSNQSSDVDCRSSRHGSLRFKPVNDNHGYGMEKYIPKYKATSGMPNGMTVSPTAPLF